MTKTQPNIFGIVSHDIGRHLGCYGVPQAGTPNLDRLASECVRFHSTSPQCSPVRASLFTGRYPHSHGVTLLYGKDRMGFNLVVDPPGARTTRKNYHIGRPV